MANIVGEEFKEYVADQINLRQEIHGKTNRTTKELAYLNSRTSWIKLASGVEVEQSRLDLVPEIASSQKYLGIGLATDFVLFNGTNGINTKTVSNVQGTGAEQITTQGEEFSSYQSPKAGVLGNSPNPAYGMLGDTKYGIVPMPGIESVNVKAMDKGTIKRASIKIKAYNRIQFDILDILYLRLGYTLLLEWGDSHYLDNKSVDNPITPLNHTITENAWFNTGNTTNQFKMLQTIEKEREKYSACYDALFGKIVNFKWTFNPDGTYDINLDIISLGDVVESLKMNVAPYLKEEKEKEETKPIKKVRRKSSTIGGKDQGATSYLAGTKTADEVQEENSPPPPTYDPKPKENIIEQLVNSLRKYTDPYFEGYNSDFWQGTGQETVDEYKYNEIFNKISFASNDNNPDTDEGQIIEIKGIPDSYKSGMIIESGRNYGSIGSYHGRTLPYSSFKNSLIPNFYDKNLKDGSDSISHNKILEKETRRQARISPSTINPERFSDYKEPVDYIQMNYYPSKYQYYIRFGAFLKLLQDLIFPYYNKDSKDPLLKVDFKVDENFMYYVPNMISTNPKVCLIRNDLFLKVEKNSRTIDGYLNIYESLEPFRYTREDKNNYGYLMNVYVNFSHITDLFKDINEEGDVFLMEMLRTLCSDINKSLGGVNKLEPKLDPATNILTIYDRATLPGRKDLLKSLGLKEPKYNLEIFGYNLNKSPNQSNFVHKAGITTEVTNDYAVMTTIGATSNGQVVGEDSTAFSKWNEGIIDRFKLEVATGRTPEGVNISSSYDQISANYYDLTNAKRPDNELAFLGLNRQYKSEGEFYSTFLNNLSYFDFVQTYATTEEVDEDGEEVLGGKIDVFDERRPIQIADPLIGASTNTITSFYNQLHKKAYTKQIGKKAKASNQGGFMPFNLNLELDGISGMKIYSKLRVQQSFLPSNYPNSIEFVITDVEHILNKNKWVTKLNTIGIPLLVLNYSNLTDELVDPFNQKLLNNINNKLYKNSEVLPTGFGTGNFDPSQNGGYNTPATLFKSVSTNGNNANLLRETLKELGYTEKGIELDNGGDITYETYLMGDAVLRKIKELYPSYKLEITGGNDHFHQDKAKGSRHTRGKGLDFVLTPRGSQTTQQLNNIVGVLEGFARGENPNFRFIDEYRHLSKKGTGDHFHISWGRGTEAQSALNLALKKSGPSYYINLLSSNDPSIKKEAQQRDKDIAELKKLNAEIKSYNGEPFGIRTQFSQTRFSPNFPEDLISARKAVEFLRKENKGLTQTQIYYQNNPGMQNYMNSSNIGGAPNPFNPK